MGDDRIVFSISEFGSAFDAERMLALLGIVFECPLGDYDRMALDLEEDPGDFGAVDEGAVLAHLSANEYATLYLRGGQSDRGVEGEIELLISRRPSENAFRVMVDRPGFREEGGVARLRALIPRVTGVFPGLDHGSAGVALRYPDYYDNLGLRPMPRCFDVHLKWLHLMGPACYEPMFTREALLGCPAFVTEELPGGVLLIQNFADPWDYDSEDTRRRLAELTQWVYDNAT